jgi:hypothetical protein
MLTLGQPKDQTSSKFSITLQVRDKKGNVTGKTKTMHSDRASDIGNFYERHQPRKHLKNRANPKNLPKGQEAETLQAQVAEYAEKKQSERNGE